MNAIRVKKETGVSAFNELRRIAFYGGELPEKAPGAPVGRAFAWRDPSTIPPRPWVYGKHLLRKAYSTTVAPGAASKSTLVHTEFLAMASGRDLLGVEVSKPLKVWYINLEEEYDELERRTHAALIHHSIDPSEIEGRFYMSGSECELITAGVDLGGGVVVHRPVIDAMKAHIIEMGYDAIAVDPFAQSHNVPETNEAYKQVAMEWRKIAQDCNCAIELVHHTRKGNGQELSSQDGRGGGALLNHARDGRVINKASDEKKRDMGIDPSKDRATYFTLTSDKPNYSTGQYARWHRTVGVKIGNGDEVATVERWNKPDAFDGITTDDVFKVQKAISSLDQPRKDAQANDWVGYTIADVLDIEMDTAGKARVKQLIKTWTANKVLVEEHLEDRKRTMRPCLVVGEWINDMRPTT